MPKTKRTGPKLVARDEDGEVISDDGNDDEDEDIEIDVSKLVKQKSNRPRSNRSKPRAKS